MADIQNVKELKVKILEKVSEDELKEKYEALVSRNKLFERNKQMAFHIIASEVGAEVKTSFASSSKEAFPLKIGEIQESEKQNFNISGYLVSTFRPFMASNNKLMMFISVADDTGTQTVTVFEDRLDDFLEGGIELGDFIKVSNLYWKDKKAYSPTFGKYSGVEKIEAGFEFENVVVNSTKQLVDGKYFVIKGLVTELPEDQKREVYHCSGGHWFKGLGDQDVGTMSLCEKCGVPMEVEKHLTVQNFLFADEEGFVEAEIGTFANMDNMEIMDEYIFGGKYHEGKFKVSYFIPLKKNG